MPISAWLTMQLAILLLKQDVFLIHGHTNRLVRSIVNGQLVLERYIWIIPLLVFIPFVFLPFLHYFFYTCAVLSVRIWVWNLELVRGGDIILYEGYNRRGRLD